MAAASENSSLSSLLLLLTEPWPGLEPIRLAAAPHFQLFLQASKLISIIKSGHLWQQLGVGKDSQGYEACQLSIEWPAASPCGTHPGVEDGCLRLPGPPQASAGPGLLRASVVSSPTSRVALAACSRARLQCSWSVEAMVSSVPDSVWPQGKVFSLVDAELQAKG